MPIHRITLPTAISTIRNAAAGIAATVRSSDRWGRAVPLVG
jgi:hypothetical protein